MVSWFDLEIGWNPVTREIFFLSPAERNLDLPGIEHALVAAVELNLDRVVARRQRKACEVNLARQGEPAPRVGALGDHAGDVDQQPDERGAAAVVRAGRAGGGGERVL